MVFSLDEQQSIKDLFLQERRVRVPLTFDVPKVEGEDKKSKLILSAVVFGVAIIFVTFVWVSSMGIVGKLIWSVLVLISVMLFIRFVLMKEAYISDSAERMLAEDYKVDEEDLFGIYSIEPVKPYVCHYTGGRVAVFIRFNKSVLVGDNITHQTHFDGLKNFYALAHDLGFTLYHLDYMDSVGKDARLGDFYDGVADCTNPVLKEMLVSVFGGLEDSLKDIHSSFDVYCLMADSSAFDFKYNVNLLISAALEANYKSFSYLNKQGVRDLAQTILNLEEFSVVATMKNLLKNNSKGLVKAVQLIDQLSGEVQNITESGDLETGVLEVRENQKEDSVVVGEKVGYATKTDVLDIFDEDDSFATDVLSTETGILNKPLARQEQEVKEVPKVALKESRKIQGGEAKIVRGNVNKGKQQDSGNNGNLDIF